MKVGFFRVEKLFKAPEKLKNKIKYSLAVSFLWTARPILLSPMTSLYHINIAVYGNCEIDCVKFKKNPM